MYTSLYICRPICAQLLVVNIPLCITICLCNCECLYILLIIANEGYMARECNECHKSKVKKSCALRPWSGICAVLSLGQERRAMHLPAHTQVQNVINYPVFGVVIVAWFVDFLHQIFFFSVIWSAFCTESTVTQSRRRWLLRTWPSASVQRCSGRRRRPSTTNARTSTAQLQQSRLSLTTPQTFSAPIASNSFVTLNGAPPRFSPLINKVIE